MPNEVGEGLPPEKQSTHNTTLHELPKKILPQASQEHKQSSLSFIRDEIATIQKEFDKSDAEFLKGKKISLEQIPSEFHAALPLVASVIAHRHNPDSPLLHPTANDIFDMKRWVGWIYNFLHFFSKTLATFFTRFVEKKASKKVNTVGNTLSQSLEVLENIPNPQQQFIDELAMFYRGVTESKSPKRSFREGLSRLSSGTDSLTADRYPLLTNALRYRKKSLTATINMAGVAMPEIMQGIASFLQDNDVKDIPQAPRPRAGIVRFFGKTFASRKLQYVERNVPATLQTVADILPDDGAAFTQKVYNFVDATMDLKKAHMSNKEIGEKVISANT